MKRHRIGRPGLFFPAIAVLWCALLLAPSAGAEQVELTEACAAAIAASDGSYVQRFDATDITGGIAALPPRTVVSVEPGQQARTCVGFHNRTGRTVSMRFTTRDVIAADDGGPASTERESEHGASRWLRLPASRVDDVRHGDLVWLALQVEVPLGQRGGSTYSSVVASLTGERGAPDGGAVVQSAPEVASQVFFDVPGGVRQTGRIEDARGPRFVWWDGFDIGTLPLLERLRGLGVATVRYDWQNRSDFSEDVRGRVVIESDLTGRDVARLEVDSAIVLRGSERSFRATWSRGIPLLGRFTPTVEVTSETGETVRRELDPIWVIPSWWYLLALVLAIAIPVALRRRSRRRMDALFARVEAAEARSAAHEDEDEDRWDEDAEHDHDWSTHR